MFVDSKKLLKEKKLKIVRKVFKISEKCTKKTWPVQMEMDVDFSSDFFVNIELKMTNRLQVIN